MTAIYTIRYEVPGAYRESYRVQAQTLRQALVMASAWRRKMRQEGRIERFRFGDGLLVMVARNGTAAAQGSWFHQIM